MYPSAAKKPVIVLKLDDVSRHGDDLAPDWLATLDVLDAHGIPASLGLICQSLVDAPASYVDRLKDLALSERYELWNHGWDHSRDPQAGTWEFCGTGYAYQRDRFERSQRIAREVLGITLKGFGPPFGKTDDDTYRVVTEHPEMRYWLHYDLPQTLPATIRTVPRHRGVALESPCHVPNPEAFFAGFALDAQEPVCVIQGHPASWLQGPRLRDFEAIISTLVDTGFQFRLPSQLSLGGQAGNSLGDQWESVTENVR